MTSWGTVMFWQSDQEQQGWAKPRQRLAGGTGSCMCGSGQGGLARLSWHCPSRSAGWPHWPASDETGENGCRAKRGVVMKTNACLGPSRTAVVSSQPRQDKPAPHFRKKRLCWPTWETRAPVTPCILMHGPRGNLGSDSRSLRKNPMTGIERRAGKRVTTRCSPRLPVRDENGGEMRTIVLCAGFSPD